MLPVFTLASTVTSFFSLAEAEVFESTVWSTFGFKLDSDGTVADLDCTSSELGAGERSTLPPRVVTEAWVRTVVLGSKVLGSVARFSSLP